ncbi:hypothetical protein OHO83_09275 [Streptomyces sp. NBC_00569]|uniref:hypothetical protein n=1 Tax=Streptomyces sp. NBC_00569 TaxID=2975780 RepID=UPI002E80D86A|nr:hypothetical protein [Streptomyces sp. NBC_00569]WUB92488.1 hypothetical protein OHO83_09275 [Streptomyces sp. NBC_00569]
MPGRTGKAQALQHSQLAVYMAGDHDPAKPGPEPPHRASFQFTAAHAALTTPEDMAQFQAQGKLVDYDAAHPDEVVVTPSAGRAEM